MRVKPWQFNILSIVYLFIAVSLPLQIMFLYEHNLSELNLAFHKLTSLNLFLMFICLVNSVLVYFASRMIFISIPVSVFAVIVNNYYVSQHGQDFLPATTYLASFAFVIIPSLLLLSRPWSVLTEPNQQWWRTQKRFNIQLPVELLKGPVKILKSVDVSATGIFLKCANSLFEEGALIELALPLGPEKIALKAKVVRKTSSKGKYPEGVGLQFTHMGWKERFALRRFLKEQ